MIILIIRLSDPQGELQSTCQRSSPQSPSPMSPTPPSHSYRGSTGNYLNVLLKDKDNSKKTLKIKEGVTDVCLMQADPTGWAAALLQCLQGSQPTGGGFFSCICGLIVLCFCPFVSSFIACRGVWYDGMKARHVVTLKPLLPSCMQKLNELLLSISFWLFYIVFVLLQNQCFLTVRRWFRQSSSIVFFPQVVYQ